MEQNISQSVKEILFFFKKSNIAQLLLNAASARLTEWQSKRHTVDEAVPDLLLDANQSDRYKWRSKANHCFSFKEQESSRKHHGSKLPTHKSPYEPHTFTD